MWVRWVNTESKACQGSSDRVFKNLQNTLFLFLSVTALFSVLLWTLHFTNMTTVRMMAVPSLASKTGALFRDPRNHAGLFAGKTTVKDKFSPSVQVYTTRLPYPLRNLLSVPFFRTLHQDGLDQRRSQRPRQCSKRGMTRHMLIGCTMFLVTANQQSRHGAWTVSGRIQLSKQYTSLDFGGQTLLFFVETASLNKNTGSPLRPRDCQTNISRFNRFWAQIVPKGFPAFLSFFAFWIFSQKCWSPGHFVGNYNDS